MNERNQFLGIVQNQQFVSLEPDLGGAAKLTRINMQDARSPESDEFDLAEHEGKAIMISGHNGGDWIYSAKVIDQAGPILTAVVQKVFAAKGKKY